MMKKILTVAAAIALLWGFSYASDRATLWRAQIGTKLRLTGEMDAIVSDLPSHFLGSAVVTGKHDGRIGMNETVIIQGMKDIHGVSITNEQFLKLYKDGVIVFGNEP
jgi:hypothetical protein